MNCQMRLLSLVMVCRNRLRVFGLHRLLVTLSHQIPPATTKPPPGAIYPPFDDAPKETFWVVAGIPGVGWRYIAVDPSLVVDGGPAKPPGHVDNAPPVAPARPGNELPTQPGHPDNRPPVTPARPGNELPTQPGHPSGQPVPPTQPSQQPGQPGQPQPRR